MEAWKGESYDLLLFVYHVCGNKIIVIVIVYYCLLFKFYRHVTSLDHKKLII